MRSFVDTWKLVDELYSDIDQGGSFFTKKPLLAHYTTASVLEQIVKNDEIWFGNPLLMNDVEEVRFGINEGTRAFLADGNIQEALSSDDFERFAAELSSAHRNFEENHAFDTYILCLCEHDEDDTDGLLSMWRGYGDSGKGVAIVFDARTLAETSSSPLIITKVHYASADERRAWFGFVGERFATIVRREQLVGDELIGATWALFARLRLFSLFTKHHGFREEREWR